MRSIDLSQMLRTEGGYIDLGRRRLLTDRGQDIRVAETPALHGRDNFWQPDCDIT